MSTCEIEKKDKQPKNVKEMTNTKTPQRNLSPGPSARRENVNVDVPCTTLRTYHEKNDFQCWNARPDRSRRLVNGTIYYSELFR